MTIKKMLFFFLFLLFFCLSNLNDAQASSFPVLVTPLLPENQSPDVHSYFDLEIYPKEESKEESKKAQTLTLLLENTSSQPVTLTLYGSNAYTSPLGNIQYIPSSRGRNAIITDSLYEVASLITPPSVVTLKGKEKKKVTVTLSMPPIKKGTALGAITISTLPENSQKKTVTPQKNTTTFTFQTALAYNVAIVFRHSTEEKLAYDYNAAGMGFSPTGVYAYVEIENKSASIMNDLYGVMRVLTKKRELLFENEFGPFNMAPKTKIHYPIFWEGKELKRGDYVIEIESEDGEGNKKKKTLPLQIKHSFLSDYQTISGVDYSNSFFTFWIFWIGLASLLVIVFLFFLYKYKKKEDSKNEKQP